LKREFRIALFFLGFVSALLAALILVRETLDAAEIEGASETRHEVAKYYNERVEIFRSEADQAGESGLFRAVLLGDSMVVSVPQALQVADTVERRVRRLLPQGPKVDVLNLGLAGTGAFDN
jgi:hypothetical protein